MKIQNVFLLFGRISVKVFTDLRANVDYISTIITFDLMFTCGTCSCGMFVFDDIYGAWLRISPVCLFSALFMKIVSLINGVLVEKFYFLFVMVDKYTISIPQTYNDGVPERVSCFQVTVSAQVGASY